MGQEAEWVKIGEIENTACRKNAVGRVTVLPIGLFLQTTAEQQNL